MTGPTCVICGDTCSSVLFDVSSFGDQPQSKFIVETYCEACDVIESNKYRRVDVSITGIDKA